MKSTGNTMETEVKKYKRYKRDLQFLLGSSGVWPNFQQHPRWLRLFLTIASTLASGVSFCGVAIFCRRNANSINVLTKGLGVLISFFSTFIKVCILAKYGKDLQSLNEGISARFESDLKIPQSRKHLLAQFPTFFKFFYIYTSFVAMTVIMMIVTSLSMIKYGKYVRMYPQVIPFHYEPGGTIHWVIYGFEMFCGFYLWSMTSGADSVFGFYTLHMVGELRLLASQYRSLKSSSNYTKDLKECINRHLVLIDSLHLLERIFGFLSIWLAVTCAISLCSLVFQVSQMKSMTYLSLFYLFCYCSTKLLQSYTYAWYGNMITVESKLCVKSVYDAQWAGCGDVRFMNDVVIILSQNPMTFSAMGCMNLSLDMFSTIIQTSVSYFFLLKTLEEKS